MDKPLDHRDEIQLVLHSNGELESGFCSKYL